MKARTLVRVIGAGAALLLALAAPAAGRTSTAPGFHPYESVPALGIEVESVGVGEFTGDAIPDVVATTGDRVYTNPTKGLKLAVLPGLAGGGFGEAVFLASHEEDYERLMPLVVGDLTGDGRQDVAVGTTFGVDVYVHTGAGLSAPALIPTANKVRALAIGALEPAGDNDLVVGTDADVLLFEGTAAGVLVPGGFTAPPTAVSTAPVRELVLADVAGDDARDVVGITSTALHVFETRREVLPHESRTTFAALAPLALTFGAGDQEAVDVAAGDTTGDARADVVALVGGAVGNGGVNLFRGISGGGLAAPTFRALPGARPDSVEMADLDGDASSEVVVLRSGEVIVAIGHTDGTISAGCPQEVPEATYIPAGLAVGRVDGDALADVVAGADASDGPVILRQRAASGAESSALSLAATPAASVPNQIVALRGTLSLPGACPIEGQDVSILELEGAAERMLGTARTDALGRFVFEVAPASPGTRRYRAMWAGDARRADAHSAVLELSVRKVATALGVRLVGHDKVKDGVRIYRGGKAVLHVDASPPGAAQQVLVTVDVRSGGSWKRHRTLTEGLDGDGNAVVKLGGRRGRTYRVQASLAEDADSLAAASRLLRFRFARR